METMSVGVLRGLIKQVFGRQAVLYDHLVREAEAAGCVQSIEVLMGRIAEHDRSHDGPTLHGSPALGWTVTVRQPERRRRVVRRHNELIIALYSALVAAGNGNWEATRV